jgi:ComF family protein
MGGLLFCISWLVPPCVLFDKCVVKSALEFLRAAVDLVLPERCPACGTITPSGGHFCGLCWQKLRFITQPWCASCAAPLEFALDDAQMCATCIAKPPSHDGIRAAVAYCDTSRQVVLKLKYGGKIAMAILIAQHLKRHLPETDERIFIVPVPLHWTRLWSRGFNQSALIAKSMARSNDHIFCPDMLIRKKRTPLLRGLSGKQRQQTLKNAFELNPKLSGKVRGARIILVDDVLTSGATSQSCVKTLKKAGAQWVQIFCWARVLHDDVPQHQANFILEP